MILRLNLAFAVAVKGDNWLKAPTNKVFGAFLMGMVMQLILNFFINCFRWFMKATKSNSSNKGWLNLLKEPAVKLTTCKSLNRWALYQLSWSEREKLSLDLISVKVGALRQ